MIARASSPWLWKWGVCGLLLLATMINYMDRLTLNQVAKRVKVEFANNDNKLYGRLEAGFGVAFAIGSVISGMIVDRYGVRWTYPLFVTLWSAAGFGTGLARNYEELLLCRTLLGLFEGGNWPCALYTTQRILPPAQRAMGNGILQSGVSLGAIATPFIVAPFLTESGATWRYPFMIIGAIGIVWVIFWFIVIRPASIPETAANQVTSRGDSLLAVFRDRRFWVLAFVVVAINGTWHFFRAWTPLLMQEQHGYSERFANWFMAAYYVATDLGSLAAGTFTLLLLRWGVSVHQSRMTAFLTFSLITLSTWVVAVLPRGWLLLFFMMLVGFGALGVFPMYYSFTQELSTKHQGKVTGALGFFCWIAMAILQAGVGWATSTPPAEQFRGLIPFAGTAAEAMLGPPSVDYRPLIAVAGCAPLLAFLVLLLFWGSAKSHDLAQPENSAEIPATEKAVS
jgi:ACS family hexuronate transporter-like MFS transporter